MKVKKIITVLSIILIIGTMSINVWAVNSKENNTLTYETKLNEDIFRVEPEDNIIEYKSSYIDGNVFIATANRIQIRDSEINGDLFLVSQSVDLKNVVVKGSVYICSTDINVQVNALSMYLSGQTINMSAESEVLRELRCLGDKVKISGKIGRDLYVDSNNLEMDENTVISGKCVVNTQNINVSDSAIIKGDLDVTKFERTGNQINILSRSQIWSSVTEFFIILVLLIIILVFFPKFKQVNSKLRLRDFVKSFFTGILELVLSFLVLIALLAIGYEIGYSFILLGLTLVLLGLGKVIFVLSFAIRMCSKKKEITSRKIICMTIIVALIVQAIELLSMVGVNGIIFVMIMNTIMGISGFGSLLKVVFVRDIEMLNRYKEDKKENKQQIEPQNDNNEMNTLREEVKKEIEEEKREIEKIKEEIKKEEVKDHTEQESIEDSSKVKNDIDNNEE